MFHGNKPENRARAGDGDPSAAPAGGGDGGAEPYTHALCSQHLNRELVWACGHGHGQEEGRQNWALELCRFLRSLSSLRKESMARDGKSFQGKTIDSFRDMFDELVEEGFNASQQTDELKGSRTLARIRTPLRRMKERKDGFLRFPEDFGVPFTSSEAGRDLRSRKGRQAVSGCFRTFRGLVSHANLSTVIKTLMKSGKSWLEAAGVAVNGRPVDLLPPRRSPEPESRTFPLSDDVAARRHVRCGGKERPPSRQGHWGPLLLSLVQPPRGRLNRHKVRKTLYTSAGRSCRASRASLRSLLSALAERFAQGAGPAWTGAGLGRAVLRGPGLWLAACCAQKGRRFCVGRDAGLERAWGLLPLSVDCQR